jgi:hypothetical protein
MRCQRCNVVMVKERFYGPGDPFWGWRCMLCGNISDPMILENRSQCATLAAKGKKEGGETSVLFSRKGKRSSTDERGVSLR